MEVYPYCMNKACGVSLRMRAVQILELVEFHGGGDADEHGFESEEGGFNVGDKSAASDEAEDNGFENEEEEEPAEEPTRTGVSAAEKKRLAAAKKRKAKRIAPTK